MLSTQAIKQADETAETFAKLFYDTLDKKRNILNKLYHENATLIWNGNCYQGIDAIKELIDVLPVSEHKIDCLDAQPLAPEAINGQTCVTLTVHGVVNYEEERRRMKTFGFNQTIILVADGDKWKIISDWVRTHESDRVN